MGIQREGWYEDPTSRHEWRWFSVGRPTDLVRDGKQKSRDPISIDEARLSESIDLKEVPDGAPLIIEPDPLGHQVMTINVRDGPVVTVPVGGNQLPNYWNWSKPAGAFESILVVAPILVALYFFFVGAVLAGAGAMAISLLFAAGGASRRRRQARKLSRPSD